MDNYGFRQFYQLQLQEQKLSNYNKNLINDCNKDRLGKLEYAQLEKSFMNSALMN